MTTLEELRRVPLFDGLSDEQLRSVLEQGEEKLVRAGEVNSREGEPVEHLYVILEGDLRITKKTADGGETVLNVYTPGNFFAEVPLLAGSPFMASRRALTDCRMFLIPNALFRRLLTENAPFSHTILQTMAERVELLQSVAGQREKLDSLGTLTAGLAHELNNPASATRRSAEGLREDFAKLRSLGWRLARAAARGELDPSALDRLERAVGEPSAEIAASLDTLERSEREEALALWIADLGLEDAWDLAPTLADAGLGAGDLGTLVEAMPEGPRGDGAALPGGRDRGLRSPRRGGERRPARLRDRGDDGGLLVHGPGAPAGRGHQPKLGGDGLRARLQAGRGRGRPRPRPRPPARRGLRRRAEPGLDRPPGQPRGRGRRGGASRGQDDVREGPRASPGLGRRRRYPQGRQGKDLRAVLHHEGRRRGNGARCGRGLQDRGRPPRGDIHVVSEPGATRFEVRLPIRGPAGGGEGMDVEWSLRAGR